MVDGEAAVEAADAPGAEDGQAGDGPGQAAEDAEEGAVAKVGRKRGRAPAEDEKFWHNAFVEQPDGKTWRCKFCSKDMVAASITGVKGHFLIEVGSENRMKKIVLIHLTRKRRKMNMNIMKMYTM